MSFGFGPGDIVAFIAFGKKVFDALKTDDGSAFEYKNAAAQCQAFTDVMSEVQRLDLSHLPEDFRKQLQGYSKNIEQHVAAFKKHTIDKFEKSMGEETKRGWFKGSPRKVQWAFGYADDLEKFTVSLGAWLQIIQASIQFRFLDRSMLLEAPSSGIQATSTTTSRVNRPPTQLPINGAQNYIDWRTETVERLRQTRTIDAISHIVYERLLSQSAPPISESNKVYTLPPDGDAEAKFLTGDVSKVEAHFDHPSPNGESGPGKDLGEEMKESRSPPDADNAIIRSINRYLTELQLPLLTNAETARLNERSSAAYTDLPLGSQHTISNGNSDIVSRVSRPEPVAAQWVARPSESNWSHKPNKSSPLAMSEKVLHMLHALGLAAQVAYSISTFCREDSSAPEEAATLALRVSQYSNLLVHAIDLMCESAPSDVLVDLSRALALDSTRVMARIQIIIRGFFAGKQYGGLRRLVTSIRLHLKKEKIKLMTAEVESLKLDLSLMLQMHQIRAPS